MIKFQNNNIIITIDSKGSKIMKSIITLPLIVMISTTSCHKQDTSKCDMGRINRSFLLSESWNYFSKTALKNQMQNQTLSKSCCKIEKLNKKHDSILSIFDNDYYKVNINIYNKNGNKVEVKRFTTVHDICGSVISHDFYRYELRR